MTNATWSGCRGDSSTSGTSISTTALSYNWAVRVSYTSRFGGLYFCTRSFFEWDPIAPLHGGHINFARFTIYGDKAGGSETICYDVRAILCDSALASTTADYGNIFNGLGYIEALSEPVTISSTSEQLWTFDFTEHGMKLIQQKIYNEEKITIALINEVDYDNVAPSGGVNHKFYYEDSTYDPVLALEWCAAPMLGSNF